MMNKSLNQFFYGIILLHIILWTVLPIISRNTVSHDTIEAFVWGQHLEWGYDKNPYLIGWLARLGTFLSWSNNAFGYYLIQQLFIGLGIWSVWKLGKCLFNPASALIAALILEGCPYFSAYVQSNNDNYPLIGLLPLAAYTLYLALTKNRLRYWLIAGAALGFSLMAKYSTALFIFVILLYLIFDPKARKAFTWPNFYLGVGIILLIALPNIIWLFKHNLVTINYVMLRKASSTPTQHFYYVYKFFKISLLNLLPCFLLFLLTYPYVYSTLDPAVKPRDDNTSKKQQDSNIKATHQAVSQYRHSHAVIPQQLNKNNFLVFLGLGPITLTLLIAIVAGWQIYWEWGAPFLCLWTLPLITYLQPSITIKSIRRFLIGVLVIILGYAFTNYLLSAKLQAGEGSGDYPAKAIAEKITRLWHEQYHTPLRYIAGSRYVAGYIAYYSPDKPKVLAEWDPQASPGVDLNDVKKYGAIFVQDGYYGASTLPKNLSDDFNNSAKFPGLILKQFPTVKILPMEKFSYYHSKPDQAPVDLLIGILAPNL